MRRDQVDRLEKFPLCLMDLQINSSVLVAKSALVDTACVRREIGEIDLFLCEPILFLASIVLPCFFSTTVACSA